MLAPSLVAVTGVGIVDDYRHTGGGDREAGAPVIDEPTSYE
jgi:hypothetical protein